MALQSASSELAIQLNTKIQSLDPIVRQLANQQNATLGVTLEYGKCPLAIFESIHKLRMDIEDMEKRSPRIIQLKTNLMEYLERGLLRDSKMLSEAFASLSIEDERYHRHHHIKAERILRKWKRSTQCGPLLSSCDKPFSVESLQMTRCSRSLESTPKRASRRSKSTAGTPNRTHRNSEMERRDDLTVSVEENTSGFLKSCTPDGKRFGHSGAESKSTDKASGSSHIHRTASARLTSCPTSAGPAYHLGSSGRHTSKRPLQVTGESPVPSTAFVPITKEDFLAVPPLVRRRAKLEDVNAVYLWMRNQTILQNRQDTRKALRPVDCHRRMRSVLFSRSDFARANIIVVGQTGEAKLHTLRHLKIIDISREGHAALKPSYLPQVTAT